MPASDPDTRAPQDSGVSSAGTFGRDALLAAETGATGAARRLRVLTVVERASLIGRLSMLAVLLFVSVFGLIDFGGLEAQKTGFLIGLLLFTATTIYTVVCVVGLQRDSEAVMWETLLFDLAAAALLVWVTGPYEAPMYPWLMGLSISMATITRRRSAWVVAGLCGGVYLGAHFVGHSSMYQMAGYVFLFVKAVALVFTGWVVSDTMHRQMERDEEMVESRKAVEDLNLSLGRRVAELNAVSEITEVIHSTLDFDNVGTLVLEILAKVIDIPSSCMFVIDKDKAETLFSASAGLAPAGWREYGEALSFGEITGLAVANEGDMFACHTVVDHAAMMVVFCAPAQHLEDLSAEDKLVLQAVGSELLVAVENSRLYKLTKRLSITDELTGLYNYRFLQQRLEDEIERAQRYSRSLSLLMLDADNFKGFNDTYGHIAGDHALSDLAEVLRAAVREIDVVCRYGGEEFSVVLPETDAEGAFVVAEKIREAVAVHAFADSDGDRRVHVTVSIGLASYPGDAADREELLRQADDALYNAKHHGRDRVRAPKRKGSPAAMKIADAAPATDSGSK